MCFVCHTREFSYGGRPWRLITHLDVLEIGDDHGARPYGYSTKELGHLQICYGTRSSSNQPLKLCYEAHRSGDRLDYEAWPSKAQLWIVVSRDRPKGI